MKAVVELNSDSVDIKSLVKNHVKGFVWQICKFPDHDSQQGARIKDYIRLRLGMDATAFENLWHGKAGLRAVMTQELRRQRSYCLQGMKLDYNGEWRASESAPTLS